jgi:hypothetical protein
VAFQQLVPQSTRQPGSYSGVVTAPTGTAYAWFRALMNAADFIDPTKQITLRTEVSRDGGATWRDDVRLDWQGSPDNVGLLARPPGFVVGNPDPVGKPAYQVRVTVTITTRTSIGAEVEFS